MQTKTTSEGFTLFTSSHPDIVKKLILKAALLSSVYAEAGVVILIIAFVLGESYVALSMLCFVIGIVLLAVGIFRVCFCSRKDVYLPTESLLKQRVLFFDLKSEPVLQHCIESGDFTLPEPVESVSNGCVKMEVLSSVDGQFVGLQLFEFIPYAYSPVTDIMYFTDQQAETINRAIKSIKMKRV